MQIKGLPVIGKSEPDRTTRVSSGVEIGDIHGGLHNVLIAGQNIYYQMIGQDSDHTQRQHLAARVKEYWIAGQLADSLPLSKSINLALRGCEDLLPKSALSRSRCNVTDAPDLVELLTGEAVNSLLLVGEPGSGKTITLLQLVEQTLQSHLNDDFPIPVVLNLSTYRSKDNFLKWVKSEVFRLYRMPERSTMGLLLAHRISLFLDGLDEVPARRRKDCVKQINEFRAKNLIRLVVTCRLSDYREIGELLEVDYAFQVQTLSEQQVVDYLDGEERLEQLSKQISADARLSEIARSPLMLRILIALALTPKAMRLPDSQIHLTEAQLFKAYVVTQFRRRSRYSISPKLIIKTLHTLAAEFQAQSLSIFYPEDLNHKFLKSERSRRWFWLATIAFAVAPLSFVVLTAQQIGFFTWARDHWVWGTIICIAFISFSGFGLIKACTASRYRAHDALVLTPLRGLRGAGIGLLSGAALIVLHGGILLATVLLGALLFLLGALAAWLGIWVLVVVAIGMIAFILTRDEPGEIIKGILLAPMAASLIISAIAGAAFWLSGLDRDSTTFNLSLLIDPILFLGKGAVSDVFPDLTASLEKEWKDVWSTWLIFAGSWAIAGLITGGFAGVFRMPNRKHSVKPSNFLYYATLNSIAIAMAAPFAFLSIVFVCHKLAGAGFKWQLGYGQVALMFSAAGFLAMGGFEAFVHVIIRLFLAAEKQISFKLISTLTECTELVLIRRIGGGYNFLHASEMAFFAGLSDVEISELEDSIVPAQEKSIALPK